MMKIDLTGKPFYLDQEAVSWVEETLAKMDTRQKAGQLFCVLFKECKESEFDYVSGILEPGACMYRVVSVSSAVDASNRLRRSSRIPMLIAANLEKGGNGIVSEGTLLGSPMEVAATGETAMAEKLARVCAAEARAVGANWAFAPIIDIDSNFRNPITNTRTFGSDPKTVKEMGEAYTRTVQEMGIAACIKHFPGDGQDERDQHLVTSINDMDAQTWMETYGEAYRAGIEAGALTCMVGHILQPAMTRKFCPDIRDEAILPGSTNKYLMTDLLRGELGFNGLITTDATPMVGYSGFLTRREAIARSIMGSRAAGQAFDACRYAPPVRTGSVLCAESQHRSAPRSSGCIPSARNFR